MDWFERLTGFKEGDYTSTRARLDVSKGQLISRENGKTYSTGRLELTSLSDLRCQAASNSESFGQIRVSLIRGDVREMHRRPEFAGALFQVASQFNLLEMIGPHKTPEDGVTIYQSDGTQGPACAMAAGAATIYRNYFAPVGDQLGQTRERQLNALADLGDVLSMRLGFAVDQLWAMENGYALCSKAGLDAISSFLECGSPDTVDELRGLLRIGLHHDVEVTDANHPYPIVSQAFCSALPVAYQRDVPSQYWSRFASLVLEGAYEATLWAAVLNAQRGGSKTVLLTSLGGGAFGNDESWIETAMRRALRLASQFDLDVRLVSYGRPSAAFLRLADAFS